ncbi:uncharacterized protein LOC125373513 [Haliotis rufescens]|uniref:uncharacterized protein LOC125373513 n=1 Tax=Haliotis rufescens TaxID=6454 RepID=UPI00201E9134|nr:uncharacterized protein LOC125373513 [Haliotis rufescens]
MNLQVKGFTYSVSDNGSIVLPLAVVCGVLVLIIVALIIYIMVNKLSRTDMHGDASNYTETSTHLGMQTIPSGSQGQDDLTPTNGTSGTTNTYSGLSHYNETNVYDGMQRNASEDGDEHSYGRIPSRQGPAYVNSGSGVGLYVNT